MIFYEKSKKINKSGFTLIELLVVIAIIGILSAVVLASLNSARQKSRDAKRVADLKQLQLAMELYFDDNYTNYPADINSLVSGGYIPNIPVDPDGSAYFFSALGSGTDCSSYHIGATIENSSNPSLDNDADAASVPNCTGGGTDFTGTDPIYDLKP